MSEAVKKIEDTKVVKDTKKKDVVTNIIKNNGGLTLKRSRDLTKEEISKLQKFDCKLVRKKAKRGNNYNHFIFVRFSPTILASIFISEIEYYLAMEELEEFKKEYNYIFETKEATGVTTTYVKDVPVRVYHVINELTNKDYKKYNVFLTPNSIFTKYFSEAENLLIIKRCPDIKFIEVIQDSENEEDRESFNTQW